MAKKASTTPGVGGRCPFCRRGKLDRSASGENLICLKCGRIVRLELRPSGEKVGTGSSPLKLLRGGAIRELLRPLPKAERLKFGLPKRIGVGYGLAWLVARKALQGDRKAKAMLEKFLGKAKAEVLLQRVKGADMRNALQGKTE